ncbi:hypothetical protein H4Q26_016094 [Puccinia striiformis f. sp. tritici PST-130]|nr:hypothetical protein H4Q26_016094 [Puccinia striiformis f. sp. tritici PST-130]
MPTYGGDEVSAVVLDIGSNTTRAGYAGEDTPKVVIPTSYGFIPGTGEGSSDTYYFGDHGPNLWRPSMEVISPLKESMVSNWTGFDTPAYYSVDRSVMTAFAAGKGTALVVDIGDELTTVTPICDGFVLRKGIQKSPIAGNVLSSILLSTSENILPTPIYPHY